MFNFQLPTMVDFVLFVGILQIKQTNIAFQTAAITIESTDFGYGSCSDLTVS